MALSSFCALDPVMFESVSNVTATPSVKMGTRRVFNGEEYVYFRNDTGSAASVGVGMVASMNSTYSLTRSSTAAGDVVYCFVKHAEVADDSYAWGLVRGIVPNIYSIGTLATGQIFVIGADGGVQTAAVTNVAETILGKMLSSGTNTTGAAYVKCFG